MGNTVNCMRAAILGAGAMYFIDPGRGRRRRALVRDKAIRLTNQARRGFEKAARDLANRRRGIAAAAASRIPFRSEEPADYILEARVRSRLGRLVSHPHAIDVTARRGIITMKGDILASETAGLLKDLSRLGGVSGVRNELHSHEKPGDLPALQGNSRKPQPQFELFQANWSPSARLVTGGVGAALAGYGLWKGGIWGTAASVAGAGLLARSVTNMELNQLLGTQPGRHSINIRKTVNIAAPIDKVYEFWSNYENFPRFMPHLKEVRETGQGRSHWVASGPGGVTAEWDAEITEVIPKELLAWRSLPGSAVENEGSVRFEPNRDSTRVTVQLSYQPPAGAAGHIFAKLFGSDPKHAMDDDLVRLKSLLEVGKTRAHGEIITQSQLPAAARTLVPAIVVSRSKTIH